MMSNIRYSDVMDGERRILEVELEGEIVPEYVVG